jgi:flavin-dependent dehydrogenase
MSSKELYDIAIIGGGLAGLCVAVQCAENGYSVILFEKEQYPFHKVCGEYISLESWNFLQRLGLSLDQFNLPLIKTLQLSDAKGRLFKFDLPLGGFGVSRYFLDNALFQIALAKGVEVCTQTKVNEVVFDNELFTVKTSQQTIVSKVAAGSFGKRSNLDIKWNRPFVLKKSSPLNNYIGIKYHIRYSHNPTEISLHNFYNGYCGISKIEDDKSCLCYLTSAENLRAANNSVDELQKKVLYKNPRLQEIFENATFIYDQPLAISQISFNKKSQVEDHVLLLGDAAGMISPLCGNGMSMAMHGSKIAFTNIDKYLQKKMLRGEMESNYTRQWQSEFSRRLWMGRAVQRFFGGDRSTSLFIKTMHSLPVLAKGLIASTHGKPF